jgi:geranylgeranyl diphosphate synthase type II
MFTYAELLDTLNRHIAELHFPDGSPELYAPIKYVLSMEGKRIRPVLMMMAYNLYRETPEEILAPATGIEAYHNYTLMHDDLMDKADMRRGKPTVHRVWSENSAILSGDAMLILAYRWMTQTSSTHTKEVVELFTQTALEICEGQQMDMAFEQRNDVTEDEYLEMIRLKTAVLLAASLKIGALLANASPQDAQQLYLFGIQAGLAFQLKDDWLDVYGNPATFGKNIGGDILCNKKTYLLIKALQHADNRQCAELDRWLHSSADNPATKIAAVTALYNQIGIRAVGEEAINMYSRQAMDTLERITVSDERKAELKKVVNNLMHRMV